MRVKENEDIFGIWEEDCSCEYYYEGYLEKFFMDKKDAKKYLLDECFTGIEKDKYEWIDGKFIDKESAKIDHHHSFEIKEINIKGR